jgi:hypothetical protein
MKKRMKNKADSRSCCREVRVGAWFSNDKNKNKNKRFGMTRSAFATGFAVLLGMSSAMAQQAAPPPAAKPAAAAPAAAAPAAAAATPANPLPVQPAPAQVASTDADLTKMVPPAAPGVFSAQKKGAGLHLVVTGHKFTSRSDIENYLAWRAAEQTLAGKGTWFTFTEARTPADKIAAAKRDPKGKRYAFRMENWRPVWRYKMQGDNAWKTWSPYSGAAFFAEGKDPKTVTDFEVSADITVKNGPMDDLDPLAFEAGPVSDLLISQVSPPT